MRFIVAAVAEVMRSVFQARRLTQTLLQHPLQSCPGPSTRTVRSRPY